MIIFQITFKTKIYHPNIDEKGQVCLPIISPENWKPAIRTDKGGLVPQVSNLVRLNTKQTKICTCLDSQDMELASNMILKLIHPKNQPRVSCYL